MTEKKENYPFFGVMADMMSHIETEIKTVKDHPFGCREIIHTPDDAYVFANITIPNSDKFNFKAETHIAIEYSELSDGNRRYIVTLQNLADENTVSMWQHIADEELFNLAKSAFMYQEDKTVKSSTGIVKTVASAFA